MNILTRTYLTYLDSNQSESVLNNQRKRAVKPKPLDESTKSRSRVLITQDSFNEESRSRNGLADTIYSIGSLNNVIYEPTKNKSIKNGNIFDFGNILTRAYLIILI